MPTNEAVDGQGMEETMGEGGERRISGHQRSRSEGSTATTAITTVTEPVREEEEEDDTDTPDRERTVSPAYLTRQHSGECSLYMYVTPCTIFTCWYCSLTVEITSCTEVLKQMLDYKQTQYAEGALADKLDTGVYVYPIFTDMQAMDNELVKNVCFQSSSR